MQPKRNNLNTYSAILLLLLISSLFLFSIDCTKLKQNRRPNKAPIFNFFLQQDTSDKSQPYNPSNFFSYGKCDETNCQAPYGKCTNADVCTCNLGYANYKTGKDTNGQVKNCLYELKSQYIAFILEFLFFFGAGLFYLERYFLALLKLFYVIFVIFYDFVLKKIFLRKYSEFKKRDIIWIGIALLLYSGLVIWQITDLTLLSMNKYLDGNQMPVLSWDYYEHMGINSNK